MEVVGLWWAAVMGRSTKKVENHCCRWRCHLVLGVSDLRFQRANQNITIHGHPDL